MATTQSTEFPSLDDVRLPSTPEDKELLKELKLAWDQHSAQWDNETKHEFVDRILKGYTKVTNTNQAQPSAHRLWKAGNITFAVWIILRVTYDEGKLSKPREWLQHKYENFDPQSWASPVSKMPAKSRGTNDGKSSSSKGNIGSHGKSQEPKSPQSIEAMEICEEESDHDDIKVDGTYKDDNNDGDDQDEANPKPITRSRFRAVNVPEPGRDPSRKRGTSNASVNLLRTKVQKTDSPKTPLSAENGHLLEPSGPSTVPTVDNQARARPLEWKAKVQDLRVYGRGLNQNRLVPNRLALTGDQTSLPPNPTAVSFTQESYDPNGFRRSQEPSLRSSAPALSLEKWANDQRISGDPRDRILYRSHSTQSDHVRAKSGLVDHRSGESAASAQSLPQSHDCRGNTRTMAPRGSSDSFMFSLSSYGKEQPQTGEALPLRLTPRDQVHQATRDLKDMKQILNSIVETSRVQLEASQREGATIQELLLPAMTEHRKDIDNLVQRTTSIEERTSDVEEYLELQLADMGGESVRNAPRDEHEEAGKG
ncbi:Uncharacterized protein LW93_4954 [Fusarium fujikuroi]|nr:Uncharacterized protein LW93_4954 [Fusarium fujikuroi]